MYYLQVDIIVDASVLIAVIANEPEKETMVGATLGAELLRPASTHWEIGNAFSGMLKRKRINFQQIEEAIEVYNRIPIRFIDVELSSALRLAGELGIYAYDAYILECARACACAILRLDPDLARAAKRAQIPVLEMKS